MVKWDYDFKSYSNKKLAEIIKCYTICFYLTFLGAIAILPIIFFAIFETSYVYSTLDMVMSISGIALLWGVSGIINGVLIGAVSEQRIREYIRSVQV